MAGRKEVAEPGSDDDVRGNNVGNESMREKIRYSVEVAGGGSGGDQRWGGSVLPVQERMAGRLGGEIELENEPEAAAAARVCFKPPLHVCAQRPALLGPLPLVR